MHWLGKLVICATSTVLAAGYATQALVSVPVSLGFMDQIAQKRNLVLVRSMLYVVDHCESYMYFC